MVLGELIPVSKVASTLPHRGHGYFVAQCVTESLEPTRLEQVCRCVRSGEDVALAKASSVKLGEKQRKLEDTHRLAVWL